MWGVMSVLNNVMKGIFAVVGAVTGFTLTQTLFFVQKVDLSKDVKLAISFFAFGAVGLIFYIISSKFIESLLDFLSKLELFIQKMTLYELLTISLGLISGLIVANLITIPIKEIEIIGIPMSITINILFGYIGITAAANKKDDSIIEALKGKKGRKASDPKLIDTSAVIDGRIVDVCKAGFLEGELVVPGFVLEELRHIADSADPLKRNRGRRGLDVLNILQKEIQHPVKVEEMDVAGGEVDDKLLNAAEKNSGKIITVDYNLIKVAEIRGVPVLNINELANAVKPIALPGEEMAVQVIKDGKENGQGIGYMEDGTMIVVEGGKKRIGETVNVTVTSVLQTPAGRMIFAKPRN